MYVLRIVQSYRTELILWEIHPGVKELFSLLNLDDVFTIQLDNPGSIFFRQTRWGLMGKRFRL